MNQTKAGATAPASIPPPLAAPLKLRNPLMGLSWLTGGDRRTVALIPPYHLQQWPQCDLTFSHGHLGQRSTKEGHAISPFARPIIPVALLYRSRGNLKPLIDHEDRPPSAVLAINQPRQAHPSAMAPRDASPPTSCFNKSRRTPPTPPQPLHLFALFPTQRARER